MTSLILVLAAKWLTDAAQNLFFLFLGAIISFYATIVFERSKRFGDILRGIGLARTYSEIYPASPSDLERAHQKCLDFWRFVESQQWELDAEGHHEAAAKVARLVAFAYRSCACLEHMMKGKARGNSIEAYLVAFQSEYQAINAKEFIQFEKAFRPSKWALLRPTPSVVLPTRQTAVVVNYFDALL